MLWNWYTIDACFLSSSWHIKNRGMFAASCIGVALLVVVLELSRRLAREFDLHIARQWRARAASQALILSRSMTNGDDDGESLTATTTLTFRYSPLQQLVRALLHATTFGLAYIIMLLAMYFNGFIIISIIIGAGLGKFLCDWEPTRIVVGPGHGDSATATATATGPLGQSKSPGIDEPTVCCG